MPGRSALLSTLAELRSAVRALLRSPGFTLITVGILSLVIGANTAIFSMVYSVLLKPLPVRAPGELVELLHQYPYPGEPRINGFPFEVYENIRANSNLLSGVFGVAGGGFNGLRIRREREEPRQAECRFVSGNYFELLGVRPAMGRLLTPKDDALQGSASSAVVVLSWNSWRSHFDADPQILGKSIVVEDLPVTIVGVAPPGFIGVNPGRAAELWMPLAVTSAMYPRGGPPGVGILGRLRPGVTLERARAELEVLYRRGWKADALGRDPNLRKMRFFVEPAGNGMSTVRDQFGRPLLFLMAAVGLLLLLACANLAGVLAVRGRSRQRDLAIRASLGSGTGRLMRTMMFESFVLSLAGSLAGILLAWLSASALVQIIASARPLERVEVDVSLDVPVILFTGAVAVFVTFLFGALPTWRASRVSPALLLARESARGSTASGQVLGKGLVVLQVAMSVVLLSAALLFARHLFELRNVDLGFEPERILIVSLDVSRSGENNAHRAAAFRNLLDELYTVPGVESVTLSGATPISGAAASRFAIAEGFTENRDQRRRVSLNWVAPAFFHTYRTPVLAGREFRQNGEAGLPVAIVNQVLAAYYFPGRNPIGRHIRFEDDSQDYEIVGVVGDAKYTDLRVDAPRTCYLPSFASDRVVGTQISIRSSLPPESLLAPVRNAVKEVGMGVQIGKTTTLFEQMDAAIVPERVVALLSRLFGSLALTLTALGIYGVLQHRVSHRVREIGIRMAVGATRSQVSGLVLRDAAMLVGTGIAFGIPITWWTQGLVVHVLDGIHAGAIPFGASALVVAGLATLAAALPAWRAGSVDPVESLRAE